MEDGLLTALSIDNHHHPSTLLSIDSSASSTHDEMGLDTTRHLIPTRPPDINLPLSSPSPQPWLGQFGHPSDIGLAQQLYLPETFLACPKLGKRCGRRGDTIWGAWFFFSFYFKPVLNDKTKAKLVWDGNGVSGFERSDLYLDAFMVQHDMENMYMWAFKERPENALGKMQLRSYMNGHARQGERPFPFSPERGFVRSHRMQRKHYRGLSNPQCVHGVEAVNCPSFASLDEGDRRRWVEMTGREIDFELPPEAGGYGSWRNSPNHPEFEHSKKLPPADPSLEGNKRKKDSASGEENGFLDDPAREPETHFSGPATAGRTTYEDDEGYLILVSLPFVDLEKVRVSWRNTMVHGVIKVWCTSTSRAPFIKRRNRTFWLADPGTEHCPPDGFVREIHLPTRIPENGEIEAYCDGQGTVLEILVPKPEAGPEEHEVRVCVLPHRTVGELTMN